MTAVDGSYMEGVRMILLAIDGKNSATNGNCKLSSIGSNLKNYPSFRDVQCQFFQSSHPHCTSLSRLDC